jgi:hypothetical protein
LRVALSVSINRLRGAKGGLATSAMVCPPNVAAVRQTSQSEDGSRFCHQHGDDAEQQPVAMIGGGLGTIGQPLRVNS